MLCIYFLAKYTSGEHLAHSSEDGLVQQVQVIGMILKNNNNLHRGTTQNINYTLHELLIKYDWVWVCSGHNF